MRCVVLLLLAAGAVADEVMRTKTRDRPAGVPVEKSADWVLAPVQNNHRLCVRRISMKALDMQITRFDAGKISC